MKLSPLTIGLCVSLVVHGAIVLAWCAIKLSGAVDGSALIKAGSPIPELEIVEAPAAGKKPDASLALAETARVPGAASRDMEKKLKETLPAPVISAPVPEKSKVEVATADAFSTEKDKELDSAESEQTSTRAMTEKNSSITAKSLPLPETGGVVSPVEYLFNPRPIYPDEARRNKKQGVVILDARISSGGYPDQVAVRYSSGYMPLDRAALAAVEQWRFIPAKMGGMGINSNVEIPVRFVLSN